MYLSENEKEELLPLLLLKKKCIWNMLRFIFHVCIIIITSYAKQLLQAKKKNKDHPGGLALANYVTGDSVVLDKGLQVQSASSPFPCILLV